MRFAPFFSRKLIFSRFFEFFWLSPFDKAEIYATIKVSARRKRQDALTSHKEVHCHMYVINDSCISCGSCADSCPVEAIDMNDELGHYAIDGDKCLDCGTCAGVCPMEAIHQE